MQNQKQPVHNEQQDGVLLARNASGGDAASRKKVNALAHPYITYQSDRFCKRFCAENKYRYQCTLQTPWGNAPQDALLCEWGNASYAWMLDDLTSEQRLQQFRGENGARLQDYLYRIANSLPFYERWKNWRFGRRINVPEYVKDLDPDAARIFLALRSRQNIAAIAQQLNLDESHVDSVAQKIVITLTSRQKLYLLNPDTAQSLSETLKINSDEDNNAEIDIPVMDPDPEQEDNVSRLRGAWNHLTAIEQFILEAMLVEEQDANDVLDALVKLGIQLNPKIAPDKTDRQQLYYFRRKTLAKLSELMGMDE